MDYQSETAHILNRIESEQRSSDVRKMHTRNLLKKRVYRKLIQDNQPFDRSKVDPMILSVTSEAENRKKEAEKVKEPEKFDHLGLLGTYLGELE